MEKAKRRSFLRVGSQSRGVVWSPNAEEVWFAATNGGSGDNPHAVTLSGKQRTITRVPGGMWLEDVRNGTALTITQQQRIDIRGLAPGAKAERELGWFGWSILRDISADGHKIVFSEAGDGGGPNYTVFVRDTDGSPPSRISDGDAMAMSPDGKWVVVRPAQGGALILVPTGAGEVKSITHDAITYNSARWLPDGKRVLASGIEAGHGVRDYVIDLGSGDSKPVTPEGMAGTYVSPDGKSTLVRSADGKWGIWPLDASGLRLIPGLDSTYLVSGWSPDGKSVFVVSGRASEGVAKLYRVNISTGKMDLWRTLGQDAAGMRGTGLPHFSSDGTAYAYDYVRTLSEAYVVTGLK